MGKIIFMLTLFSALLAQPISSFASDWGVAGKILTGIEGARILTRGDVDVFGSLFGFNKTDKYSSSKKHNHSYRSKHSCQYIQIPTTVWKKKWIPTYTEYDDMLGEVIVEGHYVKYRSYDNHQWVSTCSRQYTPSYRRRRH